MSSPNQPASLTRYSALEFAEFMASTVYHDIRLMRKYLNQPGETGITDKIFLEFYRNKPVGLGMARASPERTTGADMELWIGSGHTWYRFFAQAKVVNFSSASYQQLDHEINGVRQYDTLINYSHANRAGALYLLYNDHDAPWNCNHPVDFPQHGICTVSADQIKGASHAQSWKAIARIHAIRDVLPWRCLFGCPLLINGLGAPTSYPHSTAWGYDLEAYNEPPTLIRSILYGETTEYSPESLSRQYWKGGMDLIPKSILVADVRSKLTKPQ